jgi:hypothetical protein
MGVVSGGHVLLRAPQRLSTHKVDLKVALHVLDVDSLRMGKPTVEKVSAYCNVCLLGLIRSSRAKASLSGRVIDI